MRAWRARLAERREREAWEQAAQEEQERRRWVVDADFFTVECSAQGRHLHCWSKELSTGAATLNSYSRCNPTLGSTLHRRAAAATDASLRYDWVEAALSPGRLAAGECPVCSADAQAAGHAATEAAHRPTSAGTGAGLNVAAASFLPHAYTDEHQAAAAAFRQFAELYRQHMALPLAAAATLAARLNAVTEGEGWRMHPFACLPAGLQAARLPPLGSETMMHGSVCLQTFIGIHCADLCVTPASPPHTTPLLQAPALRSPWGRLPRCRRRQMLPALRWRRTTASGSVATTRHC